MNDYEDLTSELLKSSATLIEANGTKAENYRDHVRDYEELEAR